MLVPGTQIHKPWPDINKRILDIKGEISLEDSRKNLAEMLMYNPGFTWHLLSGMDLEGFQDAMLRCWMVRNFSMNIWSRGSSKTELAAVFCGLYSILQPATQIVIAAPGFRKSREVLERLDKFINEPKAQRLRQCISVPLKRKNDLYEMKIGKSSLCAIPLNPLVRGFRSTCLFVDEMLLVGEELFTSVLFPFLASKTGIQQALKIKNMEDFLIKKGLMKEENRATVESIKKIILLSSADYEFNFMFELFNKWIEKVIDASKATDDIKGTYFISQLGWQSIPKTIMDEDIVLKSKESMSDFMFDKEYNARFVKDSGSFFSMAKMEALTIKPGDLPCAELKGDGTSQYIITIDTNQSEAESSDNFAMSVLKLVPETKSAILVHAYAQPKYEFKKYSKYFHYLLKSFNPILIWYDETGGGFTFIDGCNQSELFKSTKTHIDKLDVDFDGDYVVALREAKLKYNKEAGKISYGQRFQSEPIGRLNDNLQNFIDRKKIYFASRLSAQDSAFSHGKEVLPDYLFDGVQNKEEAIMDFIDDVDNVIKQTKAETSFVEVKISPLGTRSFGLPQHMKRNDSPGRIRKDSYTCLLMGCWAAKVWYDFCEQPKEQTSFVPIFIR